MIMLILKFVLFPILTSISFLIEKCMIMLILKLALFAVLTSIPFLYHYLVKPRRDSVERYRNIFTAAQPQMSKARKVIWILGTRNINFYDKMKRREKPRKFFTLLLVLFLIGTQAIDNFASGEVAATYKMMAKEKRLEQLSISGKRTVAPFMQRKMVNYLYPFLTRPLVYLFTFGLTLLLFSYRVADKILTIIHNSRQGLLVISCIIILFSFFDEGRYILLSEVLFIITMGALFYPNFHGTDTPKGRKPIPQNAMINRKAA